MARDVASVVEARARVGRRAIEVVGGDESKGHQGGRIAGACLAEKAPEVGHVVVVEPCVVAEAGVV